MPKPSAFSTFKYLDNQQTSCYLHRSVQEIVQYLKSSSILPEEGAKQAISPPPLNHKNKNQNSHNKTDLMVSIFADRTHFNNNAYMSVVVANTRIVSCLEI